jgi:hypothetical protein
VPVWGSEFTTKAATLQGELIVVLRSLFAAALVVRRRYLIMVQRLLPLKGLSVFFFKSQRRKFQTRIEIKSLPLKGLGYFVIYLSVLK